MKTKAGRLALIGALLLSAMTVSAAPGLGDAKPVLDNYFSALQTGNTSALQTTLGGALLKKRMALLQNAAYPAELTEAYGQAQFKVLGWKWTGTEAVSVDVAVILSKDESLRWRLFLERSAPGAVLKIVDQAAVAE